MSRFLFDDSFKILDILVKVQCQHILVLAINVPLFFS